MSDKFDFETPNFQPSYSPINFEIPKTIRKKKSIKEYLFAGFIGGLIGALLVSIIFMGYFGTSLSNFKSDVNSVISGLNLEGSNNSAPVTKTVILNSGSSSFVTDVAKKVGPAVVGIKNKGTVYNWWTDEKQEITIGEGSGVIISKDGYIVTNNHVVSGAKNISVILSGEKEVPATIIGTDALSDIAVVKIDPKYVKAVAPLGDSSKVQVGEFVVAIGNPLGQEFAGTVTFGVVSAVNRKLDMGNGVQIPLIQTDAAINPGNSGGALVNSSGQVIGINTAKISQTGVEGMGFAIPINYVKPIVNDLIKYKKVLRPTIGISVMEYYDRSGNVMGLYISKVYSGTGAAKAGLKEGDVILQIDGKKVTTFSDIQSILSTHKIGDVITIRVLRDGQTKDFKVTLGTPVNTND
ncbi:S1C family serine protease [Caldicellulosiruptor morganii]|uniref:Trypsin-like peptidase domain-containing protein n=1 Tax=Caldicellulosiruptor morganii TaxID=1387555 RepID=A0ABY7BTU3_9FIRM|nr:trypsin-like peptidase domain-containing protein [Caldicellulosiruptor morganii]WAM34846.1 trypsin-like peptidase domain-containing protein [Caldicellulosiruptor morganii]